MSQITRSSSVTTDCATVCVLGPRELLGPLSLSAITDVTGCLLLRLVGVMDTCTTASARAPLFAQVEAASDRCIHLDLSGVQFIDGRGITLLLELHERCAPHEHPFVVAASAAVTRVVNVCELQDLLGGKDTVWTQPAPCCLRIGRR